MLVNRVSCYVQKGDYGRLIFSILVLGVLKAAKELKDENIKAKSA